MPMPDLDALVTLATHLAASAAEVHRRGLGAVRHLGTKSSSTDMVTEIDREAERLIVRVLRRERPDDAVLAEEETRLGGRSGVRWIIDPLDGTTNYIYGYPAFAVSIGVEVDGVGVIGIVHDSSRGEVFAGVRGRGATLDGRPIRAGRHADLSTALVATGFLPDREQRARLGAIAGQVLPRVRDIRRGGSAALDLCSVAAGRVDAFYELGLGEWDVAAGAVIAEAAGAEVRLIPLSAGPSPLTVAASAPLIEPLLDLLREAGVR
jgi:fructose-1,6-bisphosphatase/inositol monophosphatase family enzyme